MTERSYIYAINADMMHKGCTDMVWLKRVVEQGKWIQSVNSPLLPHVVRVSLDSYAMTRLNKKSPFVDAQIILFMIEHELNELLWSQPPRVKFDIMALNRKVEHILAQHPTTSAPLAKFNDMIQWDDLRLGLTHGNPTFGNVMFTDEGKMVLIDPFPATPEVPDMIAVDRGKMLVSTLGLEHIRHGLDFACRTVPQTVLQYTENENERVATIFWAIVHLLRYLNRTEEIKRPLIWEMIEKAKELI